MEMTWTDHENQLNRQLAWQAVRNEFYSNMCWQEKNTASHNRAYGDITPDVSPSALNHLRNLDKMNEKCMSARQFYNSVVLKFDAKIKTAQRNGAVATHAELLNQANDVIGKMGDYTTYGCYEKI